MRHLVIISLLALTQAAHAVPLELTHQGRLLDSGGVAVNGTANLDVAVYAASTGGVPLWTQTFTGVAVSQGAYALNLTGLTSDTFDGTTRYLEITADGTVQTPRVPILSVPYAVRAGAVTLGDEPGNCTPARAGTIRFAGGVFEACDGTSTQWSQLKQVLAPDGSTQAHAAIDCRRLHTAFSALPSGTYWIDPDADGDTSNAFQTRCDMVTDGGGWTVIANNNASDAEPAGCWARIATDATFVCGTGGAPTTDWAVPAWGMTFTQMAFAAYTGTWNVTTYNAMGFGSAQTLPASATAWSLAVTSANQTLPQWSALPTLHCTTAGFTSLLSVGNTIPISGVFGTNPTTVFGSDATLSNYLMGFTDSAAVAGSQVLTGLDDFQDGRGCSDIWAPVSSRGQSAFLMIR